MTDSMIQPFVVRLFLALLAAPAAIGRCAELPPEQPLWATGQIEGHITYDRDEAVRRPKPPAESPSGSNRVFKYVSKPTYFIHRAPESVANGVGLVICPGGGYQDVWLDREGHDLALWLEKRGITSLVLKYRTNSGQSDETRKYTWDQYMPAVEADARQAIRILRHRAAELKVNPQKIGICGFSAGGHLALTVALNPQASGSQQDVSGDCNFAGLFYPWLRDEYSEVIKKNANQIPPLFIMNARDDRATPAARCVDFYSKLLDAGVNAELQVFFQ